ncbi:hypothetical protein [Methylomonas albis]|uniref:PEP-CTERM protein-sorting domain-containing protein n=2 Tax=Methylomonas albis TaxID=1854563 RepID=A0ABR9D0D9_9GAMM|nr:hypothetical protein [Methylomonas albis]MBD9356563.1 hypothetical protein [Methylomonas albis]
MFDFYSKARSLCICEALLLSLAISGPATAGIVDDMLNNHVPYTRWFSNDLYANHVNLVENPGFWHRDIQGGNVSQTSWTGAATGAGVQVQPTMDPTKIPPYTDSLNYWYQRQTSFGGSTGGSRTEYLSFYPSYDSDTAEENGLVIAPVTDLRTLGLMVEGYAFRDISSTWNYRYIISNIGNSPLTLEFILSEYLDHRGVHDEFSFQNANGVFAYDQQPWNANIDLHNYDWTSLSLAVGSVLWVGFRDIHSPSSDTWGIRTEQGSYVETDNLLPVPSTHGIAVVPLPSAIWLFSIGLLGILVKRPGNLGCRLS